MLHLLSSGLAAVVLVVASAGATDHQVAQKNTAFSVRQMEVTAGDTVTFVNLDTVPHNVVSQTKGYEFEIRSQQPGSADSIRFAKPGVITVACAIHPTMQLEVTVR